MAGSSPYENICYVLDIMEILNPSSILDMGVGFGKWGFLFRLYCDIHRCRFFRSDWETRIDGIEIFPGNVEEWHEAIYDNVYIGDAFEVIDKLQKYDVIILGDVLEHFEKEKAHLLLKKCTDRASKAVIVGLPIGDWPQDTLYDNVYEKHLSKWYPQDFSRTNALVKQFKSDRKYAVITIPTDQDTAWWIKGKRSPLRRFARWVLSRRWVLGMIRKP